MNHIYLIRLVVLKRPGFPSQKYGMPMYYCNEQNYKRSKLGGRSKIEHFLLPVVMNWWGKLPSTSYKTDDRKMVVWNFSPLVWHWNESGLKTPIRLRVACRHPKERRSAHLENDPLCKLRYLLLQSRSRGAFPDTYSKHKRPSLYILRITRAKSLNLF